MAAAGLFRRRLFATDAGGLVRAGVADDFHEYEVDVRHDGREVLGVEARSVRAPWATCPGAMPQLDALRGARLGTDVWRRKDLPDPHFQCTHMYELALFAMAQAVRGGSRQYDILIPDRAAPRSEEPRGGASLDAFTGRTRATLIRDGQVVLEWELEGVTIQPPSPYAGLSIMQVGGAAARSEDDEGLEAVKILRRSTHIALARSFPTPAGAWIRKSGSLGACYAFQPERVDLGVAQPGSRRDFTESGAGLLARLGAQDHSATGNR